MVFFCVNVMLLILSFSMTSAVILLKHSAFLSEAIINKISTNETMAILLQTALCCYRFLANTTKKFYCCYLAVNFIVIVLFYYARFYMIQHSFYTLTNLIIFGYSLVFSLSTLLLISRLFFRIGYIVDNDDNILLSLEHAIKSSVGIFSGIGRRMVGAMPSTPGSGGVDRHFVLGVVTCGATVVGVGVAVSVAYDTRLSRIAAERAADIAERAADTSERAVDFQTLKPEKYNIKWDDFGRRK